MDRTLNISLEASMFNQTHSGYYQMQGLEKSETLKSVQDFNLLTLKDSYEYLKLEEYLLCTPTFQFSSDTLQNLYLFYALFSIHTVYLLVTALLMYLNDLISGEALAFHGLSTVLLLTLGYSLFFYFKRNLESRFKHFRLFYAIFVGLILLYCVFSDHRIAKLMFDAPETDSVCAFSIGFYMALAKLVIYSKFSIILCLSVSSFALFGGILLVVYPTVLGTISNELVLLCLWLVFLNFQAYKENLRLLHLFKNRLQEERSLEELGNTFKTQEEFIVVSIHTMFQYFESILSNAKAVYNMIYLKSMKTHLKAVLRYVEKVKFYAVHLGSDHAVVSNTLSNDYAEFLRNFYTDSKPEDLLNKPISLQNMEMNCPTFLLMQYQDENLDALLDSMGEEWELEFEYVAKVTGHPLVIVSKFLLSKWPIIETYNLDTSAVDNYFQAIEENHSKDSFHDIIHAAEVTHYFLYFFNDSKLIGALDSIEYLSMIIACLGHDVCKLHKSIQFLHRTKHQLAIQYNDKSIQENLTCSVIYSLLLLPQNNFLANVSEVDWFRIRSLVTSVILDLDPIRHFQLIARFKCRGLRVLDFNGENSEDTKLTLSIALKCADLGFAGKAHDAHVKWAGLLHEEFLKQGDAERQAGLPCAMLCNREVNSARDFHVIFLTSVCLPTFEVWAAYLRSTRSSDVLKQARRNLKYWRALTI